MAQALRIGAHANVTGGGGADGSFTDLQNGGGSNSGSGTGQLLVRRSFSGSEPPSSGLFSATPAALDQSLHGVDYSWPSWKGTLATHLSGGYASRLYQAGTPATGILATVPTGLGFVYSIWHEPEDNFPTQAADWRQVQKRYHRLTVLARNDLGRDDLLYASGPLTTWTPDVSQGPDLADWIPVYESSDTGDFAPPPGFSVGDPAFDVWGLDFYDRYDGVNPLSVKQNRREWDPLAAGTGNTLGLVGYLGRVVDIINTYPGASMTMSQLTWGLGELGTERGESTAESLCTDWFEDIIYGARDHESDGRFICWFETSNSGKFAPFRLPDDTQDWIVTNGALHSSNPVTPSLGSTIRLKYDVAQASGNAPIGATIRLKYAVAPLTENAVPLPTTHAIGDAVFVALACDDDNPSWPKDWVVTTIGDVPGQIGYRIVTGTEAWYGDPSPQIVIETESGATLASESWRHQAPGTITVTGATLVNDTDTVPLPEVNREGPFTGYAVCLGVDSGAGLATTEVSTWPTGYTNQAQDNDTTVIAAYGSRSYASGPHTTSGDMILGEEIGG